MSIRQSFLSLLLVMLMHLCGRQRWRVKEIDLHRRARQARALKHTLLYLEDKKGVYFVADDKLGKSVCQCSGW